MTQHWHVLEQLHGDRLRRRRGAHATIEGALETMRLLLRIAETSAGWSMPITQYGVVSCGRRECAEEEVTT